MIDVHGLAVAEGGGRLVRRDGGILFVPAWGDGAEAVLEAFRGATSGEIVDAVPASVVDAGFDVPAFACVTWSPRISLLVFGDLEIRTDHPALPMLSGAASQTWVEHTLRGVTERVVVTVDAPGGDEAPSDLEAGVVPAGGFALELVTAVDDDPATTDATDAPASSDTAQAQTAAPTDVPATAPTGAPDVPAEADAPATEPMNTPEPAPPPVPPVADEPAGGDEPVGQPDADQGTSDDDGSERPDGRPLVQAVRCDNGHLTAAGSTTCRVCGTGLSPSAPASIVPRPSLGVLALDDGRLLELDRNYRIGRKPSTDEHATGARIEGEKVSREHVEVLLREWDVLVRDCNSTNGTWIASNAQARFRRVEPDVPVRIEPGTVIRIDRRTLTFRVKED